MAKSGKKSLKAALSLQQSRLKRNQQVAQAAQAAQIRERKASTAHSVKAKGKRKALPRRSIIPFHPTDKILLVGEGNFSFTLGLLKHHVLQHLPPENVTATAYDSEDECQKKYPEANGIVEELKRRGVEIIFSIDATSLEKAKVLKGRKWDRIVWNFPHAGSGITDQDRNILSNQHLLLGFFRSAAPFLALGPVPTLRSKKPHPDSDDEPGGFDHDQGPNSASEETLTFDNPSENGPGSARGTILITLRNVYPYTEWNLPKLAKNPPAPTSFSIRRNPQYIQFRSFVFHRSDWEGYEHRMTKGERAHGAGTTGVGGEDRMWELYLKDQYDLT